MKKILITGFNGQLGRALDSVLDREKYNIYGKGSKELDITNEAMVSNVIHDIKPDIIINCAAHTAVDLCESDKENAYKINALGPKYLALAARENNAVLVHVSTDYVFDGSNSIPYVETDETCPQSVYGETKLQGEKNVMEILDKYYIVRTAWLYGDGKNFVKTMINLSQNYDKITVVNDQIGTPTSALELARMIEYIMNTGKYGIYHGTCEGSASWYEFAVKIFELSNIDIDVEPISTEQYKKTPAKRPKYSVLDNHMLNTQGSYRMKNWVDALKEYIDNIN